MFMQEMGPKFWELHILDNIIEYWNDSSINFHLKLFFLPELFLLNI